MRCTFHWFLLGIRPVRYRASYHSGSLPGHLVKGVKSCKTDIGIVSIFVESRLDRLVTHTGHLKVYEGVRFKSTQTVHKAAVWVPFDKVVLFILPSYYNHPV